MKRPMEKAAALAGGQACPGLYDGARSITVMVRLIAMRAADYSVP